jgi:hypothetical protein
MTSWWVEKELGVDLAYMSPRSTMKSKYSFNTGFWG